MPSIRLGPASNALMLRHDAAHSSGLSEINEALPDQAKAMPVNPRGISTMALDFTKCTVAAAALVASLAVGTGEVRAAAAQPYLIRVRGLVVDPDEGSRITPIGGRADITTSAVPELDLSYFITENWALELILGVTPHKASAVHTAVGDVALGKTVLLPPTLTVQYHFNPLGPFRPYVGAGLNYTFFFDTQNEGVSDLHFKNNVGYDLQAGVDVALDEHWMINFDVKKLFLSTKASMWAGTTRIQANVDIDPWIIGAGVGYRF
jgi:outer membrane protein